MVGILVPRTARATALALVLVSLCVLLAAAPAQAKTFTVDNTGDAPDYDPGNGSCDTNSSIFIFCSLRAAIQEANAYPGADTINFGIPGTGVQTIEPNPELPPITAPVTINGYTQPGSKPNTNAQGAINAKPLVELDGSSAGPLGDGLIVQSSSSVVKGLVINRFEDLGIRLGGSNNRVEGNFIGTDTSGNGDLGNEGPGVYVGSSNNTVGGTAPAARNLISGNDDRGIAIVDASNNKVQGNLIGTDKTATADLGNSSYGVLIYRAVSLASNNTVGGSASARNTIAFNGSSGVGVDILGATNNRILFNSIYSNDELGIDLGIDGPTSNDTKDPDTGPNQLQNKPTITSAKATSKKKKKLTSISGTLNSTPNKTFTVHLFSNPPGTDEGKTYLGQRTIKTHQQGNISFGVDVARSRAPVGSAITATATTVQGSTSEFSVPRERDLEVATRSPANGALPDRKEPV